MNPAHQQGADMDLAACMVSSSTAEECRLPLIDRVGTVLRQIDAGRVVSDQELRQHAHDCGFLMAAAYERYERFGEAQGRVEAVQWLDARNKALRELRSRGTQLGEPGDDAAGFFASDEEHEGTKK